jgi:predicted HTH domain antitoxin
MWWNPSWHNTNEKKEINMRISMDLPESIFSTLRQSPESFITEMRLAAAIKWFEAGMISQAKGAEVAGLSRQKFIEALDRFKVSPFQTTPDELTQEFTRE